MADANEAPVDGSLSNRLASISGGDKHTCAILSTGAVKCWGLNVDGQLGDNTKINRSVPTAVNGLDSGVTAISAGGRHTCALLATGGAKCWGFGDYGQLGDNTATSRMVPTAVYGLNIGVTAITSGSTHTCALLATGGVKCWGVNIWGELGDNTATTFRHLPTNVYGLSTGVTAIAAGANFTCALFESGGVKCWGHNARSQLGDGTNVGKLIPTNVVGFSSDVSAVTAGGYHTCALMTTNGLTCWGRNSDGELGDNTTVWRNTPTNVNGLSSGVGATTTTTTTTLVAESPTPIVTIAAGQISVATIAPVVVGSSKSQSVPVDHVSVSTSTTEVPTSRVPIATVAPNDTSRSMIPIDVPVISRGGAGLVVAGTVVPVQVTRRDNHILVDTSSFSANYSCIGADGTDMPLDNDGFLRLEHGDAIQFAVTGYAIDSEVEVRLYSDPILLGVTTVKSDGSLTAAFHIPIGVSSGAHQVVLVGKNTSGDTAIFTTGIIVGAQESTPLFVRILIAIPILGAILVGLLMPAILRRRKARPIGR